jgi:hypothetical protein
MKIRFESRITRITLAAAAALIVGTLPALAVAIPTSIGTNISTTGTLTVGDTSDLQDVTLHDTLNANNEDITNVGELDISGHINLGGNDITNGGTITATTLTDGTASLSGGALTGLTTALSIAQGGTAATSASGARTSLGLEIDTDVEAWDTDLDDWAGVSTSSKANSGSNTDITSITELTGASPITFHGTTPANTTTLDFTDPTGTNTITFKDASGTVAFTSDIPSFTNKTILGAGGKFPKNNTKYISVSAKSEATLANIVSTPMPYGCTAKNMYAVVDVAPLIGTTGTGTGIVVTLENEEVASSVTCTILYGTTTCSDLVNTSVFTAGQKWDVKLMNPANGTGTAADPNAKVGIECDAT